MFCSKMPAFREVDYFGAANWGRTTVHGLLGGAGMGQRPVFLRQKIRGAAFENLRWQGAIVGKSRTIATVRQAIGCVRYSPSSDACLHLSRPVLLLEQVEILPLETPLIPGARMLNAVCGFGQTLTNLKMRHSLCLCGIGMIM